jgi:ribose 5-phosphate isomerase B
MKIAIGSDHAGYLLKKVLIQYLEDLGYKINDIGTDSQNPVDYPDYAEKLSMEIINGNAERGIFICGSGVGASVAANKIPGIRAGLCHDSYTAHQSVEHDNINVMVLGSRVIGLELAKELVITFLNAKFSGAERHKLRLKKINGIEKRERH